jgi:hypothetical protein
MMEETFVASLMEIWCEIGYPAEVKNTQMKAIAVKLSNFYNDVRTVCLNV